METSEVCHMSFGEFCVISMNKCMELLYKGEDEENRLRIGWNCFFTCRQINMDFDLGGNLMCREIELDLLALMFLRFKLFSLRVTERDPSAN